MPTTYKLIIHRGQARIMLLFDYNANKIAKLKENTDAKWSKTLGCWHVADTAENRIKCKLQPEIVNTAYADKSFAISKDNDSALPGINAQLPLITPSVFSDNKELRIELICESNKHLPHMVKKIKGAKWNNSNARWNIPCTKESFETLCCITKGIAHIEKKLLRSQLQKIKTAKHTSINTDKESKQKSTVSLYNISQSNLHLLKTTVELLQLKAYSTATQKTYKNEIAIFLQTLKNINADSLLTEDVRSYIHNCIHKQKLSENTVHSRLNALKFLYEQVLGHVRFFVEIPRPKKPLQLPKVLGEAELRRLFAAPKNLKHKAILFIAYSAGLRVSEVVNLRLQDIDRERKQLFIHCSKGKKDRYVRLSPMVLDVLEQYYKMSEVKPKNYLFESTETGKPYSTRSAQQIFSDARKKAGILKTLSFHNLRHSFATHLLEKGVDVLFIKEILGHFNIETTQRYLHVKKEFLINIESPLDDLYRDSPVNY